MTFKTNMLRYTVFKPDMDDEGARNGVTKEQGNEKGQGEGEERRHHHPRYNKAQARQRYKKGKS